MEKIAVWNHMVWNSIIWDNPLRASKRNAKKKCIMHHGTRRNFWVRLVPRERCPLRHKALCRFGFARERESISGRATCLPIHHVLVSSSPKLRGLSADIYITKSSIRRRDACRCNYDERPHHFTLTCFSFVSVCVRKLWKLLHTCCSNTKSKQTCLNSLLVVIISRKV